MFYFQLKNELWKLFGKKRTYIGFGAFLFAQNAMLLAFRFTNWRKGAESMLQGNGYLATEFISALTVAVIMLIPQIMLLMPLYATLVGGDLVAKETEDGTLRMILSRPVSRVRLILVKWVAGVMFATLLVLALGGVALLFAWIWFPWKGMFVFEPGEVFNVLSAPEGFRLYLWAQIFLAVNASTMLTLALMFSCFNMKPAAATILALSVLFFSVVVESIPFFEDYRPFLPTHHFRCWIYIFTKPIPWWRIGESLSILLGFNITFLVIGITNFQIRDIKS